MTAGVSRGPVSHLLAGMCASDLARWISQIYGVTAARGRLNGRASTPRNAPREARRRGRVWKPHDHRRAAAAQLESCHEPGRSEPPLTGQQSASSTDYTCPRSPSSGAELGSPNPGGKRRRRSSQTRKANQTPQTSTVRGSTNTDSMNQARTRTHRGWVLTIDAQHCTHRHADTDSTRGVV